jgi:hypothetical protein
MADGQAKAAIGIRAIGAYLAVKTWISASTEHCG